MSLGKFIVFEGGEGAGKSTQIALLSEALERVNIDHIITREPGGTKGAEAIRHLLLDTEATWDGVTETLLHLAARRDHIKQQIEPALLAGTWVICDRFTYSTIAYQGAGHQLGKSYIALLSNMVIGRVQPCLNIILDIPPDIGLTRAKDHNRYEALGLTFHQYVRQSFLDSANAHPQRSIIIDANQPIDSIHHAVKHSLTERFTVHW